MDGVYSGKKNRVNDNSRLEKFTDHLLTRAVSRASILLGVPLVLWVMNNIVQQIEMNTRSARGLSDSQIVLVQQQRHLVNAFDGVVDSIEDVEGSVEIINSRLIRLETVEELRE